MELKIFEINSGDEREWVAAYSNIHALQVLLNATLQDLDDYEPDNEIIELPREKWDIYTVLDEDDQCTMTFAEWMQTYNRPDVIATSCY